MTMGKVGFNFYLNETIFSYLESQVPQVLVLPALQGNCTA